MSTFLSRKTATIYDRAVALCTKMAAMTNNQPPWSELSEEGRAGFYKLVQSQRYPKQEPNPTKLPVYHNDNLIAHVTDSQLRALMLDNLADDYYSDDKGLHVVPKPGVDVFALARWFVNRYSIEVDLSAYTKR